VDGRDTSAGNAGAGLNDDGLVTLTRGEQVCYLSITSDQSVKGGLVRDEQVLEDFMAIVSLEFPMYFIKILSCTSSFSRMVVRL